MYKKLSNAQRIRKAEQEAANAKTAQEKMAADLDYIAMMCEVELEAEQEEDHDEV